MENRKIFSFNYDIFEKITLITYKILKTREFLRKSVNKLENISIIFDRINVHLPSTIHEFFINI